MTVDFGTARAIDARAHGEPGSRTFQLRILGANNESASLWLEKQQLTQLSLALSQVLAQLGRVQEPPEDIPGFPESAGAEFRVGRIGIGLDPSTGTVSLHFFDIARGEDEDDPDVRVRVTSAACAGLNSRLQEIIASGRPLCPLCGAPLDPGGHACIRSNGHSKQPIPDDHVDGEQS
jgi:uncharacterized repeat protein (TIGR03847 family)